MTMETIRTEYVRLWVISDVHLELTRGWDLAGPAEPPQFDVLVVAGDLVPRMERGVRWLLVLQLHFSFQVSVAGVGLVSSL